MPAVPNLLTTSTKPSMPLRSATNEKTIEPISGSVTNTATKAGPAKGPTTTTGSRTDEKVQTTAFIKEVKTPMKENRGETPVPPRSSTPSLTNDTITSDAKLTELPKEKAEMGASGHTADKPVEVDLPEAIQSMTKEQKAEASKASDKPAAIDDTSTVKASKKSKALAGVKASEAVISSLDTNKTERIELDVSKLGSNKRQHPGKLDIVAAIAGSKDLQTGSVTSTPTKAETASSSTRAPSQTPSVASRPATPATTTDSPAKRTAPRTLRLTTPSVEAPPVVSTPSAAIPVLAAVARLPSRQPSLASINPPGTPTSENISDSVSMTSTSISRANSPPPGGKVGSAPVRTRSKNQVKKDRRGKARTIEEEKKIAVEDIGTPAEEPEAAPIIARKKKTKKPAAERTTAASTPTVSRPASPGPDTKEKRKAEKEVEKATPAPAAVAVKHNKKEVRAAPFTPEKIAATPPPPRTPPPSKPVQKPPLTPATIIAELRATNALISKCLDTFFKPVNHSPNQKLEQPMTMKDLEQWMVLHSRALTDEEKDQLLEGHPVHYGLETGKVWNRGLATPAGWNIQGMSQEIEDRFLELENRVREATKATRYKARKIPNVDITKLLPRVDMEKTPQTNQGKRAAQNSSLDEVMEYVNEFLPLHGEVARSGVADKVVQTVSPAAQPGSRNIEPTFSPEHAPPGTTIRIDGTVQYSLPMVEHEPMQLRDAAQASAKVSAEGRPFDQGLIEKKLAEIRKVEEADARAVNKIIKRNRKSAGH
ncbi:hypothetical protein B0A49_09103 [Cryomyces minteri]|uniref:Uncharacterized protein n=1 Tax=Cryomyces minteri TaxID=331657 RepID=A0A4U0X0C4_9PEZI|nr:hypothetical protein B0A49_09103 [Cryomyces minteri]